MIKAERLSDTLVLVALQENHDAILKSIDRHAEGYGLGSSLAFELERTFWSDKLVVKVVLYKEIDGK